MTRYQQRQAAYIGNTAAIETASDAALQYRARKLRQENQRRADTLNSLARGIAAGMAR